mmetsp:Transcript_7689/g.34827  ORF Transcript_7689/g.34827 Transcript_7689/m.34827 type:complete len:230 (+) Transcript_7689:16-705(+)
MNRSITRYRPDAAHIYASLENLKPEYRGENKRNTDGHRHTRRYHAHRTHRPRVTLLQRRGTRAQTRGIRTHRNDGADEKRSEKRDGLQPRERERGEQEQQRVRLKPVDRAGDVRPRQERTLLLFGPFLPRPLRRIGVTAAHDGVVRLPIAVDGALVRAHAVVAILVRVRMCVRVSVAILVHITVVLVVRVHLRAAGVRVDVSKRGGWIVFVVRVGVGVRVLVEVAEAEG